MLVESLPGGQRQQDDPVGLVIGAQDTRSVRFDRSESRCQSSTPADHNAGRRAGRARCARLWAWISAGSESGRLTQAIGEQNAGAAAQLAEQLGFGTFWLGGSPRLPSVRPLLDATERVVVATGIINVWQYEPADLAREYAELSPEFGDRLLVGIGIGHPEATSDYSRPLSTMRSFLDGLDGAATLIPRDRRCLAALGPKMLDLCAERTLGTPPYFVPVEHTRAARARVGDEALVAHRARLCHRP